MCLPSTPSWERRLSSKQLNSPAMARSDLARAFHRHCCSFTGMARGRKLAYPTLNLERARRARYRGKYSLSNTNCMSASNHIRLESAGPASETSVHASHATHKSSRFPEMRVLPGCLPASGFDLLSGKAPNCDTLGRKRGASSQPASYAVLHPAHSLPSSVPLFFGVARALSSLHTTRSVSISLLYIQHRRNHTVQK
jgi:hypothetical protein